MNSHKNIYKHSSSLPANIRLIPPSAGVPFARVIIPDSDKTSSSTESSISLSDSDPMILSDAAQQEPIVDSFRCGNEKSKFLELSKSLDRLKNLLPGWDSYDASPPNTTSITWAKNVFDLLIGLNFEPTQITASVEGGVGFIFTHQDRYADIECLNSGNLVAVMYTSRTEPIVWSVNADHLSIKETLEKIRTFLNA